jgi:hypothetical protein
MVPDAVSDELQQERGFVYRISTELSVSTPGVNGDQEPPDSGVGTRF